MIKLVKGVINEGIALTLNEFVTLSNPNFLFEFKNDMTNDKYYFISPDLSAYKDRYNLFNITEGINDPLNGSIVLGEEGFYKYKIYEQEGTSLDPDGLNVVEVGKMKLIGEGQEFNRNEIDTTFKVYEQ